MQALAASVTAAGYGCGIIWQVIPQTPRPGAVRDTCWFDARVRLLVDRTQEADLRLVTDDAGAARVLTMIVRGYGVLYYK